MGIRDRDWYKDHSSTRDSAPSRQNANPSDHGDGQGQPASDADVLLGYGCAAIAGVVFLFGLAMLFTSGKDDSEVRAMFIFLAALWLPAGILALMSFRFLKRKERPSSRVDSSSGTSNTFGVTTNTSRGQLLVVGVIAIILVAYFILRVGGGKGADTSFRAARRDGVSTVAPSAGSHREAIEWRGPDGEELIVRPSVVKPDGERIRLVNNPRATDPTYLRLIEFLRSDVADQRDYIDNQWVCSCFAEEVHNNAENAGLRCALVTINFADGEAHSCNLFQTTDRGLIYIDCTGGGPNEGPPSHDKVVDIQVGKSYVPRLLFPTSGWSDTAEPMGVIRDFYIHW